jgi:SAM-dependent methyltransferase
MENELSEETLKEIAAQLRCPSGETGLQTGLRMQENNDNMIRSAIASLELQAEDYVLEIGPGRAYHLPLILDPVPSVGYTAIDISETMMQEACAINQRYCETQQARFEVTDGEHIPYETDTFSKGLTVNTLYFWKDPLAYLQEIRRVMQPGGVFCIAFATRKFMENLPFTRHGFRLYEGEEVQELARSAGWAVKDVMQQTEQVQVSATDWMEREFVLLLVEKEM